MLPYSRLRALGRNLGFLSRAVLKGNKSSGRKDPAFGQRELPHMEVLLCQRTSSTFKLSLYLTQIDELIEFNLAMTQTNSILNAMLISERNAKLCEGFIRPVMN